ncbi:MAG: hypothetical protein J7J44_05630 [Deltaproteobacteria bacterium]|nr:hypothetical protein [Deltaproteobacteria bacterium]
MRANSYLVSIISLISILLLIGGCTALEQYTQPKAQAVSAVPASMPPYQGPKARIAVARFDVRAAKASQAIGDGLRDMLATALVQSQRFSVVERQELGAIMKEQELSATGAVERGARVSRGKIKGADLLIVGSVTEFEPGASGTRGGIGGGGWIPAIAAIGGAVKKAHLAIDIRIIDSATSEVVAATKIEGEAKDVNLGGIAGAFFGGGALGGGLQMYSKTPMEKAIRICIGKAVEYISQAIPANYYKY